MNAFPGTYAFGSATVILPVVNETYSLVQTVDSILETSKADVRELLIVVCDKTTRESKRWRILRIHEDADVHMAIEWLAEAYSVARKKPGKKSSRN